MKSPYGYKSTTRAGITTIDSHGQRSLQPSSGAVYVFEGFFDFLSLLAIQETEMLDADVVILNSINNLHRAIPYFQHHSRIDAFLDNDNAGRSCLETMRNTLPGIAVVDRSQLYHEYKDLNEYLIAKKKGQ